MSICGLFLFDQVLLELIKADCSLLLSFRILQVPTLDAHISLMDQPLLQPVELSGGLGDLLFAEVCHTELLQGSAHVARMGENDVWLAAQDDHEGADIELPAHIERWLRKVPLYDRLIKYADRSLFRSPLGSSSGFGPLLGRCFHWSSRYLGALPSRRLNFFFIVGIVAEIG